MHIDTTLYKGRPADATGRSAVEIACYDLLDQLGIDYGRIDHDHADTIEDCLEIEGYLQAPIHKNLVLCNRQKTKFYLLIMEGEKPFRTKDLSKQIESSRLSFAPPEDMECYLGVEPGSATILSLMNDREHQVTLLLDAPVLQCERFGCHPCKNTSTLSIATTDLLSIFLPHLNREPIVVDLPDIREG
ncbi:MAG: prolyl-tRNA synthetase associated domain-containing protein [Evtepia sp.]|uniref:prolyl-tRNA synthetase associated domain-containing protein n=1 Tax=Evtepia sp. TaxID=2773933 RepID=UPI002A74CC3B|nr:prolyl-tRNA synthetase associated domain-containing protein [Evtepia sp.]MDY3014069.1 prolyl-tRNA synthetase associated domain-containing protein [Evtepia sp.]